MGRTYRKTQRKMARSGGIAAFEYGEYPFVSADEIKKALRLKKQRLAFALMRYTGQRRSDVHRMTWTDLADGTIRVAQQKTNRKLSISLHRDLRLVLAGVTRDHVTILNTKYGQPFTVAGFSQWMRRAITDAGLPLDCQPHGLRKAAGRRLAEAVARAR